MTCNNNTAYKIYKSKKTKKSYANILLKNHSASISDLQYPDFPKGIFWKNKVQLLWHLSNSVILKDFPHFSTSQTHL